MSHLWNKVRDDMVDEKNIYKKSMNIISVPSQGYQDSRHLLQNPKVPRSVMGFSNCAQRFTGSNYLDVDSPFNSKQLKASCWNLTVQNKSTHIPGDITGNHDNVSTGSGGLTPEKKNQQEFAWDSLNTSISSTWAGSAI